MTRAIFAKETGYGWVFPNWPLEDGYVADVHAAGVKVSPYTLNKASEANLTIEAKALDLASNRGIARSLAQLQ